MPSPPFTLISCIYRSLRGQMKTGPGLLVGSDPHPKWWDGPTLFNATETGSSIPKSVGRGLNTQISLHNNAMIFLHRAPVT